MAKEFAFLFYVNDWAGGTQWLNRLQRGGYLDLLIYQVNNTSFSLEQCKLILGSDFDVIWPSIQDKFEHENGQFFNQKMRKVLHDRAAFTESRRANRLGKTKDSKPKKDKNNTSKSLVKLVGKEKEKEIVNKIEFINYCKELLKEKFDVLEFAISQKYDSWVADGWEDGHGKPIKNWKTKIGNTIPFLKPIHQTNGKHEQRQQNTNDLVALNTAANAILNGNNQG